MGSDAPAVVRLVCGKRGRVPMLTELVIRFDYGSLTPWVTCLDAGSVRAISGADMVVLRTPVVLHGGGFKTVAEFTESAGETIPFVLTLWPLPPAIAATRRSDKGFGGNRRRFGAIGPAERSLQVTGPKRWWARSLPRKL